MSEDSVVTVRMRPDSAGRFGFNVKVELWILCNTHVNMRCFRAEPISITQWLWAEWLQAALRTSAIRVWTRATWCWWSTAETCPKCLTTRSSRSFALPEPPRWEANWFSRSSPMVGGIILRVVELRDRSMSFSVSIGRRDRWARADCSARVCPRCRDGASLGYARTVAQTHLGRTQDGQGSAPIRDALSTQSAHVHQRLHTATEH